MSLALNFHLQTEFGTFFRRQTWPGCVVTTSGAILAAFHDDSPSGNIVDSIYESRDYGNTWNKISEVQGGQIDPLNRMATMPGNIVLHFSNEVNSNTCWIDRSTDGGLTWSNVHDFNPAVLNNPPYQGRTITTYNRTSAIAYGLLGHAAVDGFDSNIARTTNSGLSWTLEPIVIAGVMNTRSRSICQGSAGLMVACSTQEGAYKSTDNGASWSGPLSLPPPTDATQTFVNVGCWITDQIGLLAGNYNHPSGNYDSYLYRTTNAGSTWARIPSSSIENWPATTAVIAGYELHRLTKHGAFLGWYINNTIASPPFRYSLDTGQTWLEPGTDGYSWGSGQSTCSGAVVTAPNGKIILPITSNRGTSFYNQIWIGEWTS